MVSDTYRPRFTATRAAPAPRGCEGCHGSTGVDGGFCLDRIWIHFQSRCNCTGMVRVWKNRHTFSFTMGVVAAVGAVVNALCIDVVNNAVAKLTPFSLSVSDPFPSPQ
jgi:hypothetical protein